MSPTENRKETTMSLQFSECEEEIINMINSNTGDSALNERVSLVNGFVNQRVIDDFNKEPEIFDPEMPMIAVVGEDSGRVYLYALKALLHKFEHKKNG